MSKFSIIENNEIIDIEEFDYNYELSRFMAVYDKSAQKTKYLIEVIVSTNTDSSGNISLNTQMVDLDNIYMDRKFKVSKLMMDDLFFGSKKLSKIPRPALKILLDEQREGKNNRKVIGDFKAPAAVAIIINDDDERLPLISKFDNTYPAKDLLEWIVNYDIHSDKLTEKTKNITSRNIKLTEMIQLNGKMFKTVLDAVSERIKSNFTLKESKVKNLFGIKHEVKFKDSTSNILSKLKDASNVDISQYSGILYEINQIINEIHTMKDEINVAIAAFKYECSVLDDSFQAELRIERLSKLSAANNITELSLIGISKKYQHDFEKVREIQDIVIPLLAVRLQNIDSNIIDEDTVDILKSII